MATWRAWRLDPVRPIVSFDGIVVHVRGDGGRASRHTMHVALGVNVQGKKELLGLWLGETEGAKFWLSCLTDLKSRGLTDVFVACVDGLTGFPDAIRSAYPQAKVQLCVVHLVRAALKYVPEKDSRAVAADLKAIYQSATVGEAEAALDKFAAKWDGKYPTISKQWRLRWAEIASMFEFPPAIRKAIYTTNAIESVNSVIRKFTRNRKQYPGADSCGEVDLAVDPGGVEEVDDADRGVEGCAEPLRDLVRGPSAGPHGQMTGQIPGDAPDTKLRTGPSSPWGGRSRGGRSAGPP